MNELEWLEQQIRQRFADATMQLEQGGVKKGNHWLDVTRLDRHIEIEWRPEEGFGFSGKDPVYGEGPAEIKKTKEEALNRALQLLQ